MQHTNIKVLIGALLASLAFKGQTVIEKYPNGRVKSEITYKDSLKDGFAKYYFENGQPDAIIEFSHGELTGTIREFYETGRKYREVDTKTLDATTYPRDGSYYEKGRYNDIKFIKNGVWQEWEGTPAYKRFEWNYSNDRKDGPYTVYRRDGSVEATGYYKNGTLADTLKTYDKDGKLQQMDVWKPEEDGESSTLINTIYLSDVKADGTTELIKGKIYIWENGKKKCIGKIKS